MASKKGKAAKTVAANAADVANIAKSNPYIQRLIDDAGLRENVQKAIESSKSAYARLSNGKAPHRAIVEDKKLQKDLREAFEAVREASMALTDAPKQRARKGLGLRPQADGPRARRRARARRQRESALQGARHAVRQGGGVPVHASAGTDTDSVRAGQRRLITG